MRTMNNFFAQHGAGWPPPEEIMGESETISACSRGLAAYCNMSLVYYTDRVYIYGALDWTQSS